MEAKIVEMRKHPCRKWDDGIQIAHRWDDGMQTLAQVSETARTGAAAGHSRENGRECCYTPLWGALPLLGPQPPPPHIFYFVGLRMLLLLHAIIPCLLQGCFLVSILFGTSIPTSLKNFLYLLRYEETLVLDIHVVNIRTYIAQGRPE